MAKRKPTSDKYKRKSPQTDAEIEALFAKVQQQSQPEPAKQGTVEVPKAPEMSPAIAAQLAKLLHVGCPKLRAVRYICPRLDVEATKALTREWMASELVAAAVDEVNGGPWADLPLNERINLALDKHLAEVAFFLWSDNFSEALSREELDKFKQAREVLKAEVKGEIDESDPMQAFARFALDVMRDQAATAASKAAVPVDLQPSQADAVAKAMAKAMPKQSM